MVPYDEGYYDQQYKPLQGYQSESNLEDEDYIQEET